MSPALAPRRPWLGTIVQGLASMVAAAILLLLLRFTIKGVMIALALMACELVRVMVVLWRLETDPVALRSPRHIAAMVGITSLGFVGIEWFSSSGVTHILRQLPVILSEVDVHLRPLLIHLPSSLIGMAGLSWAWRLRLRSEAMRPVWAVVLATLLLMTLLHALAARAVLPTNVIESMAHTHYREPFID